MGLMISLLGFFITGLFLAMIVGLDWSSLRREPIHFDSTKVNQDIEEINRHMRKTDPNFTPLSNIPPPVRDDPGGFDWIGLGLLLTNYAFVVGGVIVYLVGVRIMFMGTKVTLYTHEARVEWTRSGIRRTTRTQYALSDLAMILHPATIHIIEVGVWRGFAATLVNKDKGYIQLARSKTMEALRQYAQELQTLIRIDVNEVGAELTNPPYSSPAAGSKR